MGKGFITRSETNKAYAIIRVQAANNSVVKCINDEDKENVYEKICSGEYVEFKVGYGSWTITSIRTNGYTYSKIVNVDSMKIYNVNLSSMVTYGIRIDMSNGGPATAVTYIDDAVGFDPLSVNLNTGICNYGSWEDIILNDIGCRPCLLRSTTVNMVKYLNPNDYTKFEDGTPADITSGTSGNVMVEFKKTWYKYSVDGNILTFQVANYDRSKDGFVCSAFKSMDGSGEIKDYMYYGAYEGYTDTEAGLVYSLSGKLMILNPSPYVLVNNSDIRSYCENNGPSYGLEDWCKRCYLLGLLMLVTKTRDIQSAIGYGCCIDARDLDLDEDDNPFIQSGTLDKAGLFAGYNVAGKCVKAFGIENLWGNLNSYCDGIIFKGSVMEAKEFPPYSYTDSVASGYTPVNNSEFQTGISFTPTSMITFFDGAVIIPSIGQQNNGKGWCDLIYIDGFGESYHGIHVGSYNSYDYSFDGPFCISRQIYNITARLISC